jgi:succinate-acetate transporter protein
MVLLFGGIGQCAAGMWAFAHRESIVATIFSALGLFYIWFGLSHLLFLSSGIKPITEVAGFSMGMMFLIGGGLSLYLWLLSSNQSSGLRLTLLFLWISSLSLAASFFTTLSIIRVVGGIVALTASAIAAIASFTGLHRQAGLGELPTLEQLAKKAREGLVDRIGADEAGPESEENPRRKAPAE